MASDRLLISGFLEGTTAEQLMIYFQSARKAGGGDIANIHMQEGQAEITFEEEGVAQRVFDRPSHVFKERKLEVSLVTAKAQEDKGKPYESHLASGKFPAKAGNANDRPEVRPFHEGIVSPSDACHGNVTDQGIRFPPNSETQVEAPCKVSVTGFPREASEDSIFYYFENRRRSQGGPVAEVKINPELNMAVVTFESAAVAERVVKFEQHVLDNQPITVSFLEEESTDEADNCDVSQSGVHHPEPKRCLNFYVSGFSTRTTEDTLRHYFENARRSGGGEIQELNYFPEENAAELAFLEVKDYDRLVTQEHRIDGQTLVFELQEPEVEMPLDSRKLFVEGLNPKTSYDCLQFYLEKFSGADVEDIQFGCKHDNALVTFESRPDFDQIIDKVNNNSKGLEGFKLCVRRAPISCSVLVTGLSKRTTEETIQLYFEHKRSGGGDVSGLDYHEGSERAIVHFIEPATAEGVLQKKDHTLDSMTLALRLYHPLLEEEERQREPRGKRRKKQTKAKKEIHMDLEIIAYIKMFHKDELEDLLQRLNTTIASDETANTVIISAENQGGNCTQPWAEREKAIEAFLNGFTKASIDLADGVATELQHKKVQEDDLLKKCDQVQITFAQSGSSMQFIGREAYVCEVKKEFQELARRVEEDLQLQKSVTQNVDKDIPKEKLQLLEMAGFCLELEEKSKHLRISVDTAKDRLVFEGTEMEIGKAKTEIFKFLLTTKELVMELPERCLTVLFSPKGHSFIQKSFQEQKIVATLSPGQRKSTNEAVIFGLTDAHARRAEKFLQEAVKEFSFPLQMGQDQVINGQKWKDLVSKLISSFTVDVSIDPSNTLWVSGVSNDALQCVQQVKSFLDHNTILKNLIPMPKGCSRFLVKFWKEKLEKIARKYSVKWETTDDEEGGIEVSGTAENSTKCIEEIQNLITSIQHDSLSIEKPGMGKLFSKVSGAKLLRGVEEDHRCTIERKDANQPTEEPFSEEDVHDQETDALCTYVTQEAKKISVYKDDLTKHQVDAIVNAANGQLRHIGGLAAAIVKEGGKEIQDECDKHIHTRGGPLLDGHIYTSKPGKLPCKRIIHAVGPRWEAEATKKRSEGKETREESMLAHAIRNCLEEASSLSSIAIPAVSSGVYGFPLPLCASVIIDAVVAFFKEKPSCRLSEVHLTNNDNATVAQFTNEMRKRFGKEHTFYEQGKESALRSTSKARVSTARGSKTSTNQCLTTAEGVKISVRAGDLTDEQAHVLVGSCGSTLELNNNPCAKALSQAAGAGLQQECSTKGTVNEGNIAKAGPHNLRCKAVYFAVCSPWNSGNGEKVLIDLYNKCLTGAHQSNMASIAFSSIGTGVLQFPCTTVARVYFEQAIAFSKKHPNTTLKDIRFIPFDKDIPTVKAFTDELSKRTSGSAEDKFSRNVARQRQASSQVPIFSAVKERTTDHLEQNVGPKLCFQVQAGDITQEPTEAIVVISNPELDLKRGGGAGAAILRKGGRSIQEECSRLGNQALGSVAVTGAGRLRANHIFHIVPQATTPNAMDAAVVKCLQTAELNSIKSISFPAIGTGNIGMNAKDCAKLLLESVEKFSRQNPQSVELVRITIFQPHMVEAFRAVMRMKSGEKIPSNPGMIARAAKKMASYLPFGLGGENEANPTDGIPESLPVKISLEVFAGSKINVNGAIKAIGDLMDEHCKQKVIENEAIKELSEEQMRIIHTAKVRYDTKVDIERRIGRIEVRGSSEDILEVTSQIQEILNEIKEEERKLYQAEMLAKVTEWEFKEGGQFVPYPKIINLIIETAHAEKKQRVSFSLDGDYVIDFGKMEETCLGDGRVVDVRRKDAKAIAVPAHWDAQPTDANGMEKEVHLVKLQSNATEYQKVQQYFQNSQPPHVATIVSIERVQNPGLNGVYETRKAKMDEGKGSNEMNLFHGTAKKNVADINAKGFNRSYAGAHAVMYGNGVYFAVDASYSARSTYSPPDPATGLRYMYLAKVLAGEYTLGKQGLIVPPSKNDPNNPTDSFDTVVDQNPNPKIVVTFYDWQCYPEYLITFQ